MDFVRSLLSSPVQLLLTLIAIVGVRYVCCARAPSSGYMHICGLGGKARASRTALPSPPPSSTAPPLQLPLAYIVIKQVYVAVNTVKAPDHDSEDFFENESGASKRFPAITDKGSVTVSVVVPAYNEEKRIPEERGIDDMIADLTARQAQQA